MSSPTNKNPRNSGGGTNGNLNEKGPRGIDRETKCPLLLRVFCATSRHNSISDYNKGKWKVNISIQHAKINTVNDKGSNCITNQNVLGNVRLKM